MEREEIIALMVEDLKHNQLLNGLHSIGLADDDKYILKLDMLIAKKMGYKTIPDTWLTLYQQTMLSVTHTASNDELRTVSEELYKNLNSIPR